MTSGSSGIGQAYLDANFYTQEAGRLQLTPEKVAQFQKAIREIVEEFEHEVDAIVQDFIALAENSDGEQLKKALEQDQERLNQKIELLQHQMEEKLLETMGSEYASSIKQFVTDAHDNLIQKINLEQKVRLSPGIAEQLDSVAEVSIMTIEESTIPDYIAQVPNQVMDTDHINIDGYSPDQTIPPGEPLPTNNWWTLLADSRGSGIISLYVVPDGQVITDPRLQIHLSDAKLFDPNATLGGMVQIAFPEAFPPNVPQGAYTIKSSGQGIEFNQSESFNYVGPNDNPSSSGVVTQTFPYSMVAGASEELIYPPTVTTYDDNSVTLVYKTKEGGTMTVPIVRGSPYMTFEYENVSPYFDSTSRPLDMSTVHAYFYKQVVADGAVTDPKTQISQSDARSLGLDSTLGHVDLVENTAGPPWTGGIEGQVFSYSTMAAGVVPGDAYQMYFSDIVTLNPCQYITETVIPDSVPIPNPNYNNYIHDSSKTPYSTVQRSVSASQTITGLQVEGNFTGTARVAKLPDSATQGGSSLFHDTFQAIETLIANEKSMYDLHLFGESLLRSSNFLQNYPDITGDEFNKFCSLVGYTPQQAMQELTTTWLNRIPPIPQYQNWLNLAQALKQRVDSGTSITEITQWMKNIISGNDPTYSADYAGLEPANQDFFKAFSQFVPSNYTAAGSLEAAAQTALTTYQNSEPDLHQQIVDLFNKDAWTIPLTSHYQVDDMGEWSYTYTTDNEINPYANLHFTNPPDPVSGNVLIGLLKTDLMHSENAVVSEDIYVQTIRGGLLFVESENNAIHFRDPDTTITWPDDALAQLSAEEQLRLATIYVNDVVPNLWLPDRHYDPTTYYVAKDAQNAADVAHALWELAQLNPDVKNIPGFQAALDNAVSIGLAALDDYLLAGQLSYDSTNGMMISDLGQSIPGGYADFSNAYGEDHHFSYGYLIRTAAELYEINPANFQGDPGAQRAEMVELLINDVFNDDDPNFPRLRMYDSYLGAGRATGLVPPAGAGMNEESTAEDYNCIQGIAMWAEVTNNTPLANQAATMTERVKEAAQSYWQPNSDSSVFTDRYASKEFQQFAADSIACGVNWDTNASTGNFFTPPGGDSNIFTIAIQYITGNLDLMDPAAAKAAFDYLIGEKDPSGFARIFQQNIPITAPGAAGYYSFTTILIPLIAKTSPNAALAILEWYQDANARRPDIYTYDDGNNYGTIYQQILMAKATNTTADPYPSPESYQSQLPPLPAQGATISPLDSILGAVNYTLMTVDPNSAFAPIMPLVDQEALKLKNSGNYSIQALAEQITKNILPQFPGMGVWDIVGVYITYSQTSADGAKLFKAIQAEIYALKSSGNYTVQALREWAQNTILPTLSENYPNLTDFDILQFCRTTQIDQYGVTSTVVPEPTPSPLDTYITRVTTWENQFSPNSAQVQFAESIKTILRNSPTIEAAITTIQQQLYGGTQDIYMRYLGLSENQVEAITIILPSLNVPPMTQMDQNYISAKAWVNQSSGQEKTLATALADKIYSLGSNDTNVNNVKTWAQNMIDRNEAPFSAASEAAKAQFAALTGTTLPTPVITDPLATYIDQVSAWENAFPPGSPQDQFAESIKTILRNSTTLETAITTIQQQIYNSAPQDIYMRYFGLTEGQVNAMSQILPPLNVPATTQMDQNYATAKAWVNQSSGQEKTLATSLADKIYSLGSNNTNVNSLKTWAQNMIDRGEAPFSTASKAAQEQFAAITGSTIPTPPPPPPTTGNPVEKLNGWEAQFPVGSAQYQFAEALKRAVQGLGATPTTTALVQSIETIVFSDHNNPNDIYNRFVGLTQEQVSSISTLLSDTTATLSVPTFTQMDANFQRIFAEVRTNPSPLANALLAKIQTLGSSDTGLGPLNTWAQTLVNKQDPLIKNATSGALQLFCTLTGAKETVQGASIPEYKDKVTTWMSGYPVDSAPYNLGQAILQIISPFEGQTPPKTVGDLVQAIQAQLYGNNVKDLYFRFPGLTADQMSTLSNTFTDGINKLPVPLYTTMDARYNTAYNWAHTTTLSTNDATLANALQREIEILGSSDIQIAALQQWATTMLGSVAYQQASPNAQFLFKQIANI